MTLQSGVGTTIAYKAETTFGTAAGDTGGQYLRWNTSSLNARRDSFESSENRPDQQVNDYRLGTKRPGGTIETEVNKANLDAFLGAMLRGTWTNGVAKTESEFTSVTIDSATKTATVAGGSFVTQGFKLGDIVRFADLSVAANNARNLTITALTATTMTFAESVSDLVSADSDFDIAVQGAKLIPSTDKDSFTIEQAYTDVDMSELFTGCRLNSVTLRMPANGMATASWEVMAQDVATYTASSSPYFTTPTAADTNDAMELVGGRVMIDGAVIAVVTQAEVTIAHQMQADPVVGSQIVPEIFFGTMRVSGTMSIFLEDETYLDALANETELEVTFVLKAPGTEPVDFLAIRMHRVKIGGVEKNAANAGGLVQSIPFMGLLRAGGSGTAYDQASIVLQRVNATA